MKVRTILIVSLVTSLAMTGAAQAGGVASAAKKGIAVGLARVQPTGTVTAFGGKGTTSVTTSFCNTTQCTVIFNGKYPDDITNANVLALSTSDSGIYGVTNHQVNDATPTQITVTVATFASNTTNPSSDSFHLALYLTAPPAP